MMTPSWRLITVIVVAGVWLFANLTFMLESRSNSVLGYHNRDADVLHTSSDGVLTLESAQKHGRPAVPKRQRKKVVRHKYTEPAEPHPVPLHSKPINSLQVEEAIATRRVELWVHVITYDRVKSLRRLCHSLLRASYFDEPVHLHFHVDALPSDQVHSDVMELIDNFVWPHGKKLVSVRLFNAGLIKNVIEAWYPSSMSEYAVFCEDDVELSKFWYAWVRDALHRYRFVAQASQRDPNIFGVSLYTPREQETIQPAYRDGFFHPHTLLNNGDHPYLAQMPCSWGAVYFPEHWRAFRRYVSVRHTIEIMHPERSSYTNGWGGSWIKWFYEVLYLKGWYMVYPNFPDEASFSTNHADAGVHLSADDPRINSEEFAVPLIDTPQYQPPPHQPVHRMPVLDQQKRVVESRQVLMERGQELLHGRREAFLCRCGIDCGWLVAEALGESWNTQLSAIHLANQEDCDKELEETEF